MDPLKSVPPPESQLHFLDYWRIIRIRKTVILAVFLLVVMTATVVTFILPESYSSTARIQVDRDVSDITSLTQPQAFGGYDPYFILTEFEVIQSEEILHRVIERLDLNSRWGRKWGAEGKLKTDETAMLLKRRHLALHPVRNTSLIEIEVFSEDAQEAADLANAIADVYRDYRLEERRKRSLEGIKTLEQGLQEHEQKIREAQARVDELRTKLNISDTFASENAPSPLLSAESLRRLDALRIEKQATYTEAEKLLTKLKQQSRADLRRSIPSAAPDPLLNTLLEQLFLAEQKLITLKKDYGPEHAEVIKVSATVENLNATIDQRVDGILDGLEARVASLKDGLDTLQKELDEAKKTDITNAGASQPYFDAKRYLDDLLRFRQVLMLKIASERTDMQLPKSPVSIRDRAKPGLKPVRPNRTLNITLGVIVGLIVGIGLAFFIEYLDTSVKTIDDVERSLQAPVLGVIPQNVGLLLEEGADSPHAEAYRVLRTNLLFSRKSDKLNTVCIVSAGAGEGKTTTTLNLSTVFAQSGQRVLLVDSDLRRPTLHKLLRVSNATGLTSYLLRQNKLEEVIQTTSLSTLDFLPSGKLPSSSLGILSSAQMKGLIGELKQRYDFVFFDSPPIMGVSDASILASEMDLTLQVIQYRRYPQPMNIRAKQLIEKVGGNLAGIVLNNINMSQDESYYYYSGYYHDYYARNEEETVVQQEVDAGNKTKLDIKKRF